MSYIVDRRALGALPPFPGFPGGLPGAVPGPFSPGFVPGAMPGIAGGVSMFPTSVRWGDVITVMGPFAGMFQGQVVARMQGVSGGIAIAMTGPHGGSFVVPEGAQTGSCTVEVNGRQMFGANCVVATAGPGQGRPAEHRAIRAWHGAGPMAGYDREALLKWAAMAVATWLAWRWWRKSQRRARRRRQQGG